MSMHLFACVLGGTAPGARTELHDVAFATGETLDDVHPQLLDAWFGTPQGLHVDAWTRLDSIDGHRVRLAREPADNGLHLYFVNIGGYRPGEFGEQHAWWFYVARGSGEAKARAKAELLQGREQRHKDDLHRVDQCLCIERIGAWHVHLEPDGDAAPPTVTNGYFPLPAATVRDWLDARAEAAPE